MRSHHRAGVVGVASGLLALLAGCGTETPYSPARNDAEVARLEQRLSLEPGVVGADVDFELAEGTTGSLQVRLSVNSSADVPMLLDEGVKTAWTSTVVPLTAIGVSVNDPAVPVRSETVEIAVDEEREQLERDYGPRPVDENV